MTDEITILYEDATVLAINKPSGYLSASDRFEPEIRVAARELEMEYGRLWPIHHVDQDTSGVLLFAKNEQAARGLWRRLEDREISLVYHTVVGTRPSWTETVCEYSLTPDGDRMHRTIIDGAGKPALTEFTVLGCHAKLAIIEARPMTTRPDQIRIHLAALGYPVLCDPLYGDGKPLFLSKIKRRWKGDADRERPLLSRTALHSFSIGFVHPVSKQALTIEAPYPKDFKALVTQLRKM